MPGTRYSISIRGFATRSAWAMMLSVLGAGIGMADPICDPGGPYEPCLGNCPYPTQFDGSGSYSPDGKIISYHWDFGDGGTASGVMPEHLYVVERRCAPVQTLSIWGFHGYAHRERRRQLCQLLYNSGAGCLRR